MSTTPTSTTTAFSAGAIAIAVPGLIAPNAFTRIYGIKGEGPGLTFMTRLWATRTIALGALGLATNDAEFRRSVLAATASMCGADVLAAIVTPALPARTRLMAGLTSAAFGVAAALLAVETPPADAVHL